MRGGGGGGTERGVQADAGNLEGLTGGRVAEVKTG